MKSDMKPPNELVSGPIKSSEFNLKYLKNFKIRNKTRPDKTEELAVVEAETTIIKIDLQSGNFPSSNSKARKHDIDPANNPAVIDWNIIKFKLPIQIFLRPLILSITPIREAFVNRLVSPCSRIPLNVKITGINTNNSGTLVNTFQVL